VGDDLMAISGKKVKRLTNRELEILGLVASGYTNSEISEKLCISPNTTRNHMHHIYVKLKINSRIELIQYAIRNGISEDLYPACLRP
jgi:DNA-binding NarL/FixJ family response regulator